MLKELTTTFKSGELTAVVGESGRGKTTLLGILLGFYRPTTGEVRWNSSRLESQSQLQQYRISYIPQVSAYLNDSLIHNITLGTALTDASRFNLKRLARIFLDQPTLELIEKEFEAHPVELGLKISGGQRQRLAILRAVFHKPDIVILDEATNALDLDAELNMIVRLKRELPESIIIAVTHSPEVARHADAVLELS
jgi:ABC-type transport system involved in cytochrome bd biosynthesis fused ATPase/permease subunit